jgi:hypothetical protein
VSIYIFVVEIYKLMNLGSASSSLQVIVLCEGKMATGLDYDSRRDIEGGVDKELQGVYGTKHYSNRGMLLI